MTASRRVDPLTATPDDGISDAQASGLAGLLGRLDRPYPDGGIGHLSFTEAGDLIVALRTELIGIEGRA